MHAFRFLSNLSLFLTFCSQPIFGLCLSETESNACCIEEIKCVKRCPHRIYVGPEAYYLRRDREGGTRQEGGVYGARAGYDYIKRYCFYVGGEAAYGRGRLHGHSGTGHRLKSTFIDASIEGRVGYTFQQKEGCRFAFTPFVGGGYIVEKNNFIHPTPITVHFRTECSYVTAGFLSSMTCSPCFDIGINFKAKYMIDARNQVSHDADSDVHKMLIKNEMHYRVDLPLTYYLCSDFALSLVPFYEYRHYGNQANFPFDFLDTQLNMYGVTLKLTGCL